MALRANRLLLDLLTVILTGLGLATVAGQSAGHLDWLAGTLAVLTARRSPGSGASPSPPA
jgi:hypothetical protein